MERLLLTGAAGSIGSVLRKKLAPLAEILRVSDINDLGDAAPNEEIVYCDLSKEDDVYKLVKGCNGIVHFGGISIEKSCSSIRPANIRACTIYMKQQEKQASHASSLPARTMFRLI